MKNYIFSFFALCLICNSLSAQMPGDTIVVQTFDYAHDTRDSLFQFPDLPGVSFEKILMMYNMRCKNGLVSPPISGQTNVGCGEWDYSCNTYITDSSKVDSTNAQHASHIISGFSGTNYAYTTQPSYTFYQSTQQQVDYLSTISETTATVGTGAINSNVPFRTQAQNGKSQFLWLANELTANGLAAGAISSIRLNITNAGSAPQSLKVRMQHTTKTSLSAATPTMTGFTEVYYLNTTLVNGINQLNFYNNFNWNGTDNILVEFSFSNLATGTDNLVMSDNTPTVMGLVAGGDDYSFEFVGNNHIDLGSGNFSNFTDKVSISFWAKGNPAFLPTHTSVLYATNAQNHRQANIHFPWSDGTVYWDCGSGGSYDRISKLATPSQYEGNWNHWTFTKNATIGSMAIYINGVYWLSGTSKNIPLQFSSFMLGGAPAMLNPYFGKIDELSIWNTELNSATISAWMNQSITPSHPKYANLIAYYKFNEGAGSNTADASTAAANGTISGPSLWSMMKGKDIFKEFTETNNRPMLTFVQGTYNQTITPIVVMDSMANIPNTVYSFAVDNANNLVSVDTNAYYHAGYSYIYNGDTGALLDSVNYPATDTINITQLNYFPKTPARFQIMSFVTPYGINLDLGQTGKTWTFDVTDFAPILKGKKRLSMDAGGQSQEEMDIKFMFIVGTPPRDVKDIINIWKVENSNYTNILNDNKFGPKTVLMDANASAYKIRTMITGHGQEGEFIPRTHLLNLNGGAPEFSWDVWKACAENPIYPQGGTWIYDRAGWCPGMATDLQEFDISSMVTPGSATLIDYGLTTATGQTNYWVSNQLVSYGTANFSLDASIVDVKNPSEKVEYIRSNSICNSPTVKIRNTGSTPLTSLDIDYWVNNNTVHESYHWTGNLNFLETEEVVLPSSHNLWSPSTTTDNSFHVTIQKPNNGTDEYVFNNHYNSKFVIPPVMPSDFILALKTNSAGAETSYKLLDKDGNVILNRNNLANNTNYRDTLHLAVGCYSLQIFDSDDDGIDFWANNDGIGSFKLLAMNNNPIKTFDGDFGKSFIYNFTTNFPLSFEEMNAINEIEIFPNPASKSFSVASQNIESKEIRIFNNLGQLISLPFTKENGKIIFNSSNLVSGLYFIVFTDKNGKEQSKQLMIE